MSLKFFRIVLVVLCALLGASANAAINLIPNGDLSYNNGKYPNFWRLTKGKNLRYDLSAGPGGTPALFLTGATQLRQFNTIKLVPGERYRMSAKIKLKTGGSSGRADIVIHNDGWNDECGLMKLPVSNEWRKVKRDFVAFPSKNKLYGAVIRSNYKKGELAVADIRLVPLSGKAIAAFKAQNKFKCENLVTNGILDASQVDFPPFWSIQGKAGYKQDGSPTGKGAIVLLGESGTVILRQQNSCKLVPGGIYCMSALIKTEKLKASNFRIILYNDGWRSESGILAVPANTPWKSFKSCFSVPKSADDTYNFAVVLSKGVSGKVELADIKLIPMNAKAANGASSLLRNLGSDKLVALKPLLMHIPADNPKLYLKWFGDNKGKNFTCNVDGEAARKGVLSNDGLLTFDLSGVAVGVHSLKISGTKQTTNYQIRIIETLPKVVTTRLNNLVKKMAPLNLKNGASCEFIMPHDGWLYVTAPSKDGIITIDGVKNPVKGEGFAYAKRGKRQLALAGTSGKVAMKLVPIIYYYQPFAGPYLKGSIRHSWQLAKNNNYFKAINAIGQLGNCNLSSENAKELTKLNIHRIGSSSAFFKNAKAMAKDINSNLQRINTSVFAGSTLDEFPIGNISQLAQFNEAAANIQVPEGKFLWSWLYGAPPVGSVISEFISQNLNSGKGSGALLFEAYCTPSRIEKSARKYCKAKIITNAQTFKRISPNILHRLGMIFIHSNMPTSLTAAIYPEVDLKYYLDMQFKTAATAPELDGLGMIGVWGANYADEEMARWTVALCRHYAVEGNTTLLSKKYGFKYNPGFLQNCDFDNGLKHWKTEGNVTVGNTGFYGRKVQWRWTAPKGTGDNYCIMTRGTTPNGVSQKIKGLEVGKFYKLQYLTGDAVDVYTKKGGNPSTLKISVAIEGAEILPKLTFHCPASMKFKGRKYKTNVDQVVFKATKADPVIRFSDEANEEGRQAALNYIALTPYFCE
jgi:hypothetical protein